MKSSVICWPWQVPGTAENLGKPAKPATSARQPERRPHFRVSLAQTEPESAASLSCKADRGSGWPTACVHCLTHASACVCVCLRVSRDENSENSRAGAATREGRGEVRTATRGDRSWTAAPPQTFQAPPTDLRLATGLVAANGAVASQGSPETSGRARLREARFFHSSARPNRPSRRAAPSHGLAGTGQGADLKSLTAHPSRSSPQVSSWPGATVATPEG